MVSWLYRTLPGPAPVRLVLVVALLVAVGVLLWFVVFPWIGTPGSLFPSGTVG